MKKSAARSATNAGDCSWKPQPSCVPGAAQREHRAGQREERDQDARGEYEALQAHRARVAMRVLDEAHDLDAEHREDARHEIQEDPAEEGESMAKSRLPADDSAGSLRGRSGRGRLGHGADGCHDGNGLARAGPRGLPLTPRR
jgi:hypothetical protein